MRDVALAVLEEAVPNPGDRQRRRGLSAAGDATPICRSMCCSRMWSCRGARRDRSGERRAPIAPRSAGSLRDGFANLMRANRHSDVRDPCCTSLTAARIARRDRGAARKRDLIAGAQPRTGDTAGAGPRQRRSRPRHPPPIPQCCGMKTCRMKDDAGSQQHRFRLRRSASGFRRRRRNVISTRTGGAHAGSRYQSARTAQTIGRARSRHRAGLGACSMLEAVTGEKPVAEPARTGAAPATEKTRGTGCAWRRG